jgi:hypothetical protein
MVKNVWGKKPIGITIHVYDDINNGNGKDLQTDLNELNNLIDNWSTTM